MDTLKQKIFRLLKWSEKYTKTDMVYASTSGFWLMSNQTIGAITSLVLSIIFANFIPKEIFGMYKYVISMAGVIAAFSLTGINTAVVRAVAQGFDKILKRAVTLQLFWSIPRVLLGLSISLYYFYHSHTVYGVAFLLVAFLSPMATIANTYGPYLEGKKDFKASSLYNIASNLLYFLTMTLIGIFHPTVIFLISGYYISMCISHLFFFFRTIKKSPPIKTDVRESDLQYAKELSVMNVINTITTQIDNIVIYLFLGPAQLAVYTFATLIPERIRTIFGIIGIAALPRLSEKHNIIDVNLTQKIIRLSLFASAIIVVYFFLAPYIFTLLFPLYMDSLIYSQIYALSILAIASNISVPALFAGNKQKALYVVSVGVPIIKIIISLIGIIFWGLWGAVFARVLNYFLILCTSTYYANTAFKKHE